MKKIKIPYDEKKQNLVARLNKNKLHQKTLIIFHGLTTSKDHPPIPKLEKIAQSNQYNTISVDMYGHGESCGEFQNLTVTKGIKTIDSVLNYLKNDKFLQLSVFAESFAGICAILSIQNFPEIQKLILKAPVVDYKEIEKRRRDEKTLKKWKENGYISFTNSFGETKKLGYEFHKDVWNHNAYEAAESISAKTLIQHGKKDPTVPYKQSKKLDSIINDSKLILYPEAEHKIELSENGTDMFKDIEEFLRT